MEGPEGEEIELIGGTGQVLAVEIDDLGDQGLGIGNGGGGHKVSLEAADSHPSQRARSMGHSAPGC